MMRNSLLIMAVLAVGFAIPAFTQQTNTVDQQTRQQVEGIVARLAEALSKADGQSYQALYATNAINISALASRPANKSEISRMRAKWGSPSPRRSMMSSQYLVGREL
jgi:hypothetical protein